MKIIIDGVDKSNSEITSLTELSDVTLSSVIDNDLLQFNSGTSEWENNSLTSIGDSTYLKLDGSNANTTLNIGSQNFITTGPGTFGNIIDNGLVANSGIYTDSSKLLTDEVPSSGILGYWNRSGTTVSLSSTNDVLKITSNTNPQLTLAFNGSNETQFTTNSDGTLDIFPGGYEIFADFGPDLVVNGTFDDGTTGWTEVGTWITGDDAGDNFVRNNQTDLETLTQDVGAAGLIQVIVDYLVTNPIMAASGIKIGSQVLDLVKDGVRHQATFLLNATGDLQLFNTGSNKNAQVKVWDIQLRRAIALNTGDMTSNGDVSFRGLKNVLATDSSGDESLALSTGTTASKEGAVAIGRNSLVTVGDGVALGFNNSVTGTQSMSFGRGNTSSGNNGSTTIGKNNTASGVADSYAFGSSVINSGSDSFVFGRQINNSTNSCLAWGNGSINMRLTSTGLKLGADGSAAGTLDIVGDIVLDTTTGTKLGTATNQKIGILGSTPIIQQTTSSQTPATFAANSSGISDDTATWNGYTIGDLVAILQAYGWLA